MQFVFYRFVILIINFRFIRSPEIGCIQDISLCGVQHLAVGKLYGFAEDDVQIFVIVRLQGVAEDLSDAQYGVLVVTANGISLVAYQVVNVSPDTRSVLVGTAPFDGDIIQLQQPRWAREKVVQRAADDFNVAAVAADNMFEPPALYAGMSKQHAVGGIRQLEQAAVLVKHLTDGVVIHHGMAAVIRGERKIVGREIGHVVIAQQQDNLVAVAFIEGNDFLKVAEGVAHLDALEGIGVEIVAQKYNLVVAFGVLAGCFPETATVNVGKY